MPLSGEEDADNAVMAAVEAFRSLSALKPSERAEWLERIADCLESKFEEIARWKLRYRKPILLGKWMQKGRLKLPILLE